MARIKSLLTISVLIVTSTAKCKNATSEENSNLLRDVFMEPKLGTDGIVFVNSTPANLQSQIQPLLSSGLRKLHLTLQLQGTKNMVDLNFLWDLDDLEYLWVTSIEDRCHNMLLIKFSPQNDSYLSITNLHYNIKLPGKVREEFMTFILSMKSLQVLDIRGTYFVRYVSVYSFVESLCSVVNVSSLKAVSLQSTYHEQGLINHNFTLNFTRLLEPLKHSPLEYLDISHNGLYVLEGNFLEFTPQLKILDLSYNNLEYGGNRIQFYSFALLHPTLEIINIEKQSFGEVFRQLPQNEIIAHTTRTKRSHVSDISLIVHCLRSLNATLNNVSHTQLCEIVHCFSKLKHYNYNIIPCRFIPDLKHIMQWLPHSNCGYGLKIPISPNLKSIDVSSWGSTYCSGTQLDSTITTYCFQTNKVTSVSLSNNPNGWFRTFLNLNIVGAEQLEKLELQQNQQQFTLTNCKFLQSFPNLKYLNLSGNFVKLDNTTLLNDTFAVIEFLDLSSNGLSNADLPVTFIINSVHLKFLNLMGNKLETFHLLFNNTPNLTTVNLSDNKIRYIMADTLDSLKQHKTTLLVLNLQNNLLYCGCAMQAIATIDFIRSPLDHNLQFTSSASYQCNDGIKTLQISKVDLNTLRSTCFPSHLQLILSITLANFAFLVLVFTLGLLYKYRYHLRTLYFRLKLRLQLPRSQTRFKYDVFISYCADDRFWVHGSLMKELEDKYGYRLCIHYRDFKPGADIAEAILEAIDKSRSVIFVLSKFALKSGWCEFELKVAHGRSVRENKGLIIIKLENIKVEKDTPKLVKELLDSRVYMEWPDVRGTEEQDTSITKKIKLRQDLFWTKLGNVLCDRHVGYKGCLNCLQKINRDDVTAIADPDSLDLSNADSNLIEDVSLLSP